MEQHLLWILPLAGFIAWVTKLILNKRKEREAQTLPSVQHDAAARTADSTEKARTKKEDTQRSNDLWNKAAGKLTTHIESLSKQTSYTVPPMILDIDAELRSKVSQQMEADSNEESDFTLTCNQLNDLMFHLSTDNGGDINKIWDELERKFEKLEKTLRQR
jgi:HSP90 family molecular chaperone